MINIDTVKSYIDYGLSIIPANENKSPALSSWKEYQQQIMQKYEIERYFKNSEHVAIICGNVSGKVEVIDIDCKYDDTGELAKSFFELLKDNIPDVFERLVIASTKNQGWHMYYRCNEIEGNKKLANNSKGEVLIETRGEGGYVIAPPSKGYSLKKGSFDKIPLISPEEREIILSIAKQFNELTTEEKQKFKLNSEFTGISSFDDYNQRGDTIQLLLDHGWSLVKEVGDRIHLKRPGNTDSNVSGNWHKTKRIFYPFSNSTQFEAGKGYNSSGVFALLECNNDFSEASHKLYDLGFGDRLINSSPNKSIVPVKKSPITMLPIDGFPIEIQNLINACHETYGTPRDFWAGSVLSATALAIGDKMKLTTKYDNVPIFWICIIGNVSSGKTEAQKLIMKPFIDIDNSSFEKYKVYQKEFERISKMSKKEKIDEGIADMKKPVLFQYRVKDATPEALATIHEINKRGLIIERDELKGWIDDFGRYNKSGEQSNMLSVWSQSPLVCNRKNSEPINIPNPIINVLGGMQPDLLPSLGKDNRAENGFVSRICFIYPDTDLKPKYREGKLSNDMYNEWEKFIHDLVGLPEETSFKLGADAQKIYSNWFDENAMKINNEPSQHLKGVYGKLDIISLRIAIDIKGMRLIYNSDYEEYISGEIMQSAIDITEYFRATALKVYDRMFGATCQMDKSAIISWALTNLNKPKKEIASFFETSRSQVDRIINKKNLVN